MRNTEPHSIAQLLCAPALLLLCGPAGARAQRLPPQECDIPDVNECISNPCANGAVCTESNNNTESDPNPIPHHAYRCTCLAGFANGTCASPPTWLREVPQYEGVCNVATGGNCDLELNECLREPCQASCASNGMCACFQSEPMNSDGDETPPSYYCDFASEEDDPCISNPCQNGATCSLASPGDGRHQWLLTCTDGVPVATFDTSRSHKQVIVYDGSSRNEPELLTCGGYCDGESQQPCSNVTACRTVQGTGSNITVTFSSPPVDTDDQAAFVSVTYTCDNTTVAGGRRRSQAVATPLIQRLSATRVETQSERRALQGATDNECSGSDSSVGLSSHRPCDDGSPNTFSGFCSDQVCQGVVWDFHNEIQCGGFLPTTEPLETPAQAKAACIADQSCGGVSDRVCGGENSTIPEEFGRYALCNGHAPTPIGDADACLVSVRNLIPEYSGMEYAQGHVSPVVTETAHSEFGTTFLLYLELSAGESNIYTIFGDSPSRPLIFPAAYNAPLASQIGDVGIPPIILPEDAYDSWLTVGNVDKDLVSSIGVDTSTWQTNGLYVDNGAAFLMDPSTGLEGTALIAQVTGTYGCAEVAIVNAQGKSADGGRDWEQEGIIFELGCGHGSRCTADGKSDLCRHDGVCQAEDFHSFSCQCTEGYASMDCSYQVIELTDGSTFDMAVANSSSSGIARDAYVCSCAVGYADGMCGYEYIREYEEQCTVAFGSNCDVDVDECVSTPCANNATCIESGTDSTVPIDSYQCGCPPGWAGGFCSTELEQYEDLCHLVGGKCDVDIDECVSSPCQHASSCADSHLNSSIPLNKYRCSCQPGFINGLCDADYQEFIAVYNDTEYTRLCTVLTGGNCDMDVNECLSSPCQHNGTCSDSTTASGVSADAYHCQCTEEWSTTANTNCMDCHIGKVFETVDSCRDCTAGKFSDTPGAVFCTNCTAGRFVSTPAAYAESLCQACPAGQFSDEGQPNCTLCAAGQFQHATGRPSCDSCQPGSTTDTLRNPGAVSCTACSAGRYSSLPTVDCAECPPGHITNTLTATGAVSCTACSPGQYTVISTSNCEMCVHGSVTDTLAREGASSCTQCSAGRYSEEPTADCAQCFAGRFAEPGSTKCRVCAGHNCIFTPLGANYSADCSGPEWVANLDQSACIACSAGTEPSLDRSLCNTCPTGTASENGIQCLMCNDTNVNHNQSTVSNEFKTACVPCRPGFGANLYASRCDSCPAQSFAPCSGSGCQPCARGLLVTEDRTGCFPSYQCSAASGCPIGHPCFLPEDCEHCEPGAISPGGEPCTNCSDLGPGWVASPRQTECIQCPPGKEPTEDRSGCRSCQLDYISLLGSECQPCSATQIANSGHTKCVDCNDGEVAANGVCSCAANYYNSSSAIIKCGSLCEMNKEKTTTDQGSRVESVSVCSKCPPCVRCPTGANGLSSTPLINPGFGIPETYQGLSLEKLISTDVISTMITVYQCPLPEFCSGDHFIVDRHLVTADNVDRVLEAEWTIQSDEDLEGWRQQLVSLASAAGIRIEAATALTQSTFGSSIQDFSIEQLKEVLRGYYSQFTDVAFEPNIGDEFKVNFIDLTETVVIPDAAIATVTSIEEADGGDATHYETNFSCAVGYDQSSPLCTLCEDDYAGGSTAPCKHCDAGTTGYRVLVFMFALAIAYYISTVLPTWLISQYRARANRKQTRNRKEGSEANKLQLVGGANTQQTSVYVYMKIIVSHFQVLLQFKIIMDIDWPVEFQQILDYISLLKGDLLNYLNIKCAVRLNLYGDFAVAMLFVPFTYVCALLFNEARRRRIARRQSISPMEINMEAMGGSSLPQPQQLPTQAEDKRKDANGSGLLNNMFMILFCIYPFLATRICHVFSCVTLHPNGGADGVTERWQQYDYSVDCNSGGYHVLEGIAVLMFVCYPIGVPVFAMWVFAKNWPRLHGLHSAPTIRQQYRMDGSVAVEKMPWWYGDRSTFYFMVRDYRPQVFYYDIVEFIRKFALTGLLMIGAERGSVSQIVLGIILAFAFGLGNAILQPYADQRTNIFRILADCSLFITLLIVLVLHFKDNLDLECEYLTNYKLKCILIGVNFILLILGANQELLRRCLKLYRQTNLVGILYNPDDKVVDGEGDYATVCRGEYRATVNAKPVAAAVKAKMFDPAIEAVETALMLECDGHPNIVKLFKIQQDGAKSYLAMELGECSVEACYSGFSVGRERKQLDKIALCKAIAEGVQHMHKSGFVHGNITPANVVIFGTTPKLCGFSCTRSIESTVATQMDTIRGTRGYQPLELLVRKLMVTAEINNPEAVDVFGLGCTMFFILSSGSQAFATTRAENLELNIETGNSGIEAAANVTAEAKHLMKQMVRPGPNARCSVETVLSHPLFWTLHQKLQYLGDTVGSVLPERIHRSEHPFVEEIEALLDTCIGPYNASNPENGGSWAAAFNNRYPLNGDWGTAISTPQNDEQNYHVFGATPSKQEEAASATSDDMIQLVSTDDKEIRSVGLLKFIRNVYSQRAHHIEAGRFESEMALCTWLLEPFPFLLTGVYQVDARYQLTHTVAHDGGSYGSSVEQSQQQQREDLTVNPLDPL